MHECAERVVAGVSKAHFVVRVFICRIGSQRTQDMMDDIYMTVIQREVCIL